jgi:hypothetical protein
LKLSKLILLIALIIPCGYSFADEASKKEAEVLLNTLGLDKALQQTISNMLDLQLQQNPALLPYKQVMLEFFNKYMSYDSLKAEMVTIYSDAFTASELKEINAFYESPTGRKTIEKMPELMAKGGQLGAKRVQEHLPELQEMIKVESERIQKLQGNETEK